MAARDGEEEQGLLLISMFCVKRNGSVRLEVTKERNK
jgi:hypothetical protein